MADHATHCRTADSAENAAVTDGMAYPGTGGSADSGTAQGATSGKQQSRDQRGDESLCLFHGVLRGSTGIHRTPVLDKAA